jgi:AcrR family transcriptional regulator
MIMNRQKQIIQAATQLIAHEGLHSLTLSRIAEKVNMTKQGVLHYFPSVNALKQAVLNWCDTQYLKKYIDTIETTTPYPGRALQVYVEAVLVPYRRQNDILSVAAATLHSSICDTADFGDIYMQSYARLKADCVADGSDIAEAATIIATLDALCFGSPLVESLDETERELTWNLLLHRIQNMKGAQK